MKMRVIKTVIDALGTVTKETSTGNGEIENKKTRENHPNYSILKIGQNTEKSSGDLRRLVVTQTPVRRHHLSLV